MGYSVVMRIGIPLTVENRPQIIRGSYDRIGDIAIIKIKNHNKALKLSESLMKSGSGVTTVFQDTGLEGDFRTRKLELLAGDGHSKTEYRENGVRFVLDVSRVYFSPRLATERQRVVSSVRDGEVIVDMFAGIGPFSISISKFRNVTIFAIDSNPDAIEFLKKSMELNKLIGEVRPVLGDARKVAESMRDVDRVIMNLPHEGTNYLSLAKQILKVGGFIHFYIIGDVGTIENAMEKCRLLGLTIEDKRIVHGYSPREDMVMLLLKKGS